MLPEKVKKCLSRMSGKLSRTVLRRGKGRNPFSLVDFTSKLFNNFCEKNCIQQSMSRAGCPYDNAPMERFYNTLKHEYFNLYSFNSADELDQGIYEFIYMKYNHIRPHSYNGGRTPYAARYAA